jgi:multidrug efflux pump subunit AcrB
VIAWFARNRVAANLLMITIGVAGLLGLGSVRQVTFPTVSFDQVAVHVAYPGATPEEIEKTICVRIEEAIYGVDGVKRTSARAGEGQASIFAHLSLGANPRRVVEEIQSRVGALRTLPTGAEPPIVQEMIDDGILLSVVLFGDVDERSLRQLGERVRDDLSQQPGLAEVDLVGTRPYEITVEVSEAALRAHELSFDDVADAVRSSSVELPGGSLDTEMGELLLRTGEEASRGRDLEWRVLLSGSDGTRLQLGDVAKVVDGFAEDDSSARMDGRPAVLVRVHERNAGQVLETSRIVRAYVEGERAALPTGVQMFVWDDESAELRARRELLVRNGLQGLALVVLVLGLFLGLRLASWVAAGIPVAFLGALFAMSVLGTSLNMISLFAFIVALGLVVDDAIVVGECIAVEQQHGGDPLEAAIRGAKRVALPVIVTVLTTVVFVLPSVTSPGFLGKMSRPLGIVLIACLVFSLVEALLVLPAHLAGGPSRSRGPAARPSLSDRVDARVRRFIETRYLPCLRQALRRPGLTLAVAVAICLWVLALPVGGWVPFSFLPSVESESIEVELEFPKGTPAEVTWAAIDALEAEARAVGRSVDAETPGSEPPAIAHILASVGRDPSHVDVFRVESGDGHEGRVRIELSPSEVRSVGSRELVERWRERTGPLAGGPRIRFVSDGLNDAPSLELELAGRDPAALVAVAGELRALLAGLAGVRQIEDSHRAGKRELRLRVRPEGEALGLTEAELARQVRQGFQGERVQSLPRGREEVPVVVRYPRSGRRSLADLEAARVRTPAGAEIPLPLVARVEPAQGPATIHRSERRRTLSVWADVDAAVISVADVLAEVEHGLPAILAQHPDVAVALGGISRDQEEVNESRSRATPLAVLVAYVLLAVTMRSYTDPLLVLVALPFGFAGAVAAHAVLGLSLSGFSIAGTIALLGVVVNDSLVLLDAVRRAEAKGLALDEALCQAGAQRFRAIVVTSLTTFLGLLPLLFERSSQSEWLKPVAAALAVGVLFATLVTLLVVPAAARLLEDARSRLRRVRTASDPEQPAGRGEAAALLRRA